MTKSLEQLKRKTEPLEELKRKADAAIDDATKVAGLIADLSEMVSAIYDIVDKHADFILNIQRLVMENEREIEKLKKAQAVSSEGH